MGKQKRQRQKPHKENPTGLLSVKDFEESEEVIKNNKEKALQSVYDDVQSCNLEEKLSALQTLTSMSCDIFMARQIAKDGIARIIGPLLLDHNAAIRANTAGTLRDIAENGGEDAYTELIKHDIMTPLVALLKQYYSDWQPKDRKEKDARDERETFVQAVTLLWTLCANNENAIKCANEEDLALFLTKFLDINIYGIEIVIVITQCLTCLSDENCTAITKIKQSESVLLRLLDLTADDDKTAIQVLALKTSVADLLISMNNCTDNNWTHVLYKVLSILCEVLAIDHKHILSYLVSVLPHENNASSSDKKKKVQGNRRTLGMQEQALQILANLCFEDEDNGIDSDIDVTEGTMEIESECPDDDFMNNDTKIMSTLSVELIEVINNCNLIDKIWDKTQLVVDKDSQEILDQTTEGKAVLKQFHDIRCAAYLCINNLLPSFEIDVFGVADLHKKWLEIGSIVFKDVVSNDIKLLEAATAAMRAILQRLAEIRADCNFFKQLTVNDIQPMLNGACRCSNANVRVNLIRILCNLVQVMINNKILENSEMIKFISTFLLDICDGKSTETQVWVIAESIDAIMDIYAEDETDVIAADINLVSRLTSSKSYFYSKVQQQKKHLKDGIFVVSTVKDNLKRFIKYKEKRIGNLRQNVC